LDDPTSSLTAAELRRLDGFLKTAQRLRGRTLDAKLAEADKVVDELCSKVTAPSSIAGSSPPPSTWRSNSRRCLGACIAGYEWFQLAGTTEAVNNAGKRWAN